MLGMMSLKGQGMAQSDTEAETWLRKAAEQGNAEAQAMLGVMCMKGQGVRKNAVVAYMWLLLAAAQGNEIAAEVKAQVGPHMTPAQITESQELASQWQAKIPQGANEPN